MDVEAGNRRSSAGWCHGGCRTPASSRTPARVESPGGCSERLRVLLEPDLRRGVCPAAALKAQRLSLRVQDRAQDELSVLLDLFVTSLPSLALCKEDMVAQLSSSARQAIASAFWRGSDRCLIRSERIN